MSANAMAQQFFRIRNSDLEAQIKYAQSKDKFSKNVALRELKEKYGWDEDFVENIDLLDFIQKNPEYFI